MERIEDLEGGLFGSLPFYTTSEERKIPMKQQPTIGRTVIVKGFHSNGSDEHPAVITRVHGLVGDCGYGDQYCVNVTLFPDASSPSFFISMYLFESREQAEEYRRFSQYSAIAFWPDRV